MTTSRITQQVAEVLVRQNSSNIKARVTQQVMMVMLQDTASKMQVRQFSVDVLAQDTVVANTNVELTHFVRLTLHDSPANPKTVTQQVAEVAVQQDAASIETRVTQQVLEVLMSFITPHFVTQQVAEVAVQQNASAVTVRSTHAVIEVLQTVPPGPAYDNVIQPIAVMI